MMPACLCMLDADCMEQLYNNKTRSNSLMHCLDHPAWSTAKSLSGLGSTLLIMTLHETQDMTSRGQGLLVNKQSSNHCKTDAPPGGKGGGKPHLK